MQAVLPPGGETTKAAWCWEKKRGGPGELARGRDHVFLLHLCAGVPHPPFLPVPMFGMRLQTSQK